MCLSDSCWVEKGQMAKWLFLRSLSVIPMIDQDGPAFHQSSASKRKDILKVSHLFKALLWKQDLFSNSCSISCSVELNENFVESKKGNKIPNKTSHHCREKDSGDGVKFAFCCVWETANLSLQEYFIYIYIIYKYIQYIYKCASDDP